METAPGMMTTATTSSGSAQTDPVQGGAGCSAGCIAGIVVGSVALVALLVAVTVVIIIVVSKN